MGSALLGPLWSDRARLFSTSRWPSDILLTKLCVFFVFPRFFCGNATPFYNSQHDEMRFVTMMSAR